MRILDGISDILQKGRLLLARRILPIRCARLFVLQLRLRASVPQAADAAIQWDAQDTLEDLP